MSPRLGSSDLFVEYVYTDIAFKLRIPSLKTSGEFSDMKFLFKLTNGLVDCLALMGNFMLRVPVKRTRQNDSFVIGKYSLLYTPNCLVTRMWKYANDRGIDVYDVVLLDNKATLIDFEWSATFLKL